MMTKYQVMTPKRRFAPRLVIRVEDALVPTRAYELFAPPNELPMNFGKFLNDCNQNSIEMTTFWRDFLDINTCSILPREVGAKASFLVIVLHHQYIL
jgi:hypothetical protein